MTTTIEIDKVRCVCVKRDESKRIVYMIYPDVNGFSDDWLKMQAAKHDCSIVVIYVALNDWNNCLTPWPEPGETKGAEPFGGKAADFMTAIQSMIIPETNKALVISEVSERNLIGVSLGGLFTLWQWMKYDTFNSIACLSGSFWYNGFIEWFEKLSAPQKTGHAYFLLGKDEPKSKVKAFRPVGVNTELIVSKLKADGISVKFDPVDGDHFANPIQRAESALNALD